MLTETLTEKIGNVLVADDDPGDVYLIRQAFEELGLGNRLYTVENGNEALSYLKREGDFHSAQPVQIAMIDLNMPGMNGLDVLYRLKHDPKLEAIPVLIFTTSERKSDINASYAQGASSYIVKPTQFNDLLDVLRRVMLYWTTVSRCPEPN